LIEISAGFFTIFTIAIIFIKVGMREMDSHREVLKKINELYYSIFEHDGYGDIKIDMRILKRGQKEIIVSCGKQYRYVVDYQSADKPFICKNN
jgi:hypothetical protein